MLLYNKEHLMNVEFNNISCAHFHSIKLMTLFSMDARFNLQFERMDDFQCSSKFYLCANKTEDNDNNGKCHKRETNRQKLTTMANIHRPNDQYFIYQNIDRFQKNVQK